MNPETATAFNALPIGVATIDAELRVESWNKTLARWSHVAPNDAIGRSLGDIFADNSDKGIRKRLGSVFSQGQTVILSSTMHRRVLPLTTADGRPMFQRVHASAAPGRPGRALLVIEDVTTAVQQLIDLRSERRRLRASEASLRSKNATIAAERARAEAANEAKSEFLANMSHEVRTPLTAIKGFAEVVAEQSESPFASDAARRVVRNSEHLLAIVNDILDLSKIEAGKLAFSPEPCSPADTTTEIQRMVESRAAEKGLTFETRVADGCPETIYADPMRLRQVLLNLVDNAVKFTDKGSVVLRVGVASEDASMVNISVTDTGVGITPDQIEAIFKPFEQEDSSTQRRFGGSGLGLTISRQLVSRMGGVINACSEPGRGSTFSVQLPIGSGAPAGRASTGEIRSVMPGNASPLAGRRVLVAEDGLDNRVLVEFLLARAGADVVLTQDGQQAVRAFQAASEAFDCVILDMQMPVMDGYTAVRDLREMGYRGPVVALTAHAMEGDRENALAAGCDDYATKPIDAPQLISLLADLIEKRRSVDSGGALVGL